ncbi:aldo/keto reductase [Leptospira yasudae]|uniref:aldo/keto reductase n=1 Tax=Leptospira yasudae TaxID=2202201 RepID=UPI001C4F020E|nr:aldo/keto reductase [Leptospira yasudae]MBW0434104.1 aldo/keto reductase [Leptospira yasudae]
MGQELILGTVQFGLNYGVANKTGQINEEEASKILDIAFSSGIKTLDTAIAYGDSERILGKLNRDRFELITKLPGLPKDCSSPDLWVKRSIEESLERLRIPKIKALLLHDISVLFGEFGNEVYTRIRHFIDEGKIEKFGVSIYSYRDLDRIPDFVQYDILQAPFSVFDQSLLKSGYTERLRSRGVIVQARSIFLQGLLLMKIHERPKYFDRWKSHFRLWDDWRKTQIYEPLEACIKFVQSVSDISQVVFGVDSSTQLNQILSIFKDQREIIFPSYLSSEDENLIFPSKWNLS